MHSLLACEASVAKNLLMVTPSRDEGLLCACGPAKVVPLCSCLQTRFGVGCAGLMLLFVLSVARETHGRAGVSSLLPVTCYQLLFVFMLFMQLARSTLVPP